MLICGVKATHDAAVAVIDGNKLIFSIELEKVGNNSRYSALSTLDDVVSILGREDCPIGEIDRFVLDGWGPPGSDIDFEIVLPSGNRDSLKVAPYLWPYSTPDPMKRSWFSGLRKTFLESGYASFSHAAGHIMASYCSSPFARQKEDALALAWDGGMLPQLYEIQASTRKVRQVGPLFSMIGNMFSGFCQEFSPFNVNKAGMTPEQLERLELEVPGKAMAYAGLGSVNEKTFATFSQLFDKVSKLSTHDAENLAKAVISSRNSHFSEMTNADIIASYQAYIGKAIVDAFSTYIGRAERRGSVNLCLSGGCGLNIKWNSILRNSGLFKDIWIPPFTNDSGGAIGAACCEMVRETQSFVLDWGVYSGPKLNAAGHREGWRREACDARGLGNLLHNEGRPVTVLYGRAELGPRALGNRSIIAPACDPKMKDKLNEIKNRESYRPVSPICLAEHANEVFSPGGNDPYMLFDHRVQHDWRDRIPSVIHSDGTARLQTVEISMPGTAIGDVLNFYYQASGVPVLCNTSANMLGRGFFPDVQTAMDWGKTKYIWDGEYIYEKV